jgi:hypothetical protein
LLDRGDVDVVDGGEVKDDCFESWAVGVLFWSFAAAWSWVVPKELLVNVHVDVRGLGERRMVRTKDGHQGEGSGRGLFGGWWRRHGLLADPSNGWHLDS